MSGDIYWNSVLALLHFDGSNGSTTLTNEVSGGATPTISGSGALSTAQVKFGTASWKGNSATYFELAVGSSGSFTGDFTLEWFGHSLENGACTFYSTTGSSYLYNGSFQGYGGSALSISVTQSGWKHFVICRQGSTMRAYVDGVQTGTATYSGTVDLRTTQWGRYVPNNNLYSTGYIDELRITDGVCRYPGGTTFTPSSSTFDNFEPATEVILQASGPLQSATAVATSTCATTVQASSPLQSAKIVAQLRNAAIIQAITPITPEATFLEWKKNRIAQIQSWGLNEYLADKQMRIADLKIKRDERIHLRADAQRRVNELGSLQTRTQKQAWCTDLTENASGIVATIDVKGQSDLTLIAPGGRAPIYSDGKILTSKKTAKISALQAEKAKKSTRRVEVGAAILEADSAEAAKKAELEIAITSFNLLEGADKVIAGQTVTRLTVELGRIRDDRVKLLVERNTLDADIAKLEADIIEWQAKPASDTPVYGDGKMLKTHLMSPAQAFFNAAIFPGWQKYLPTYRWGSITSLDKNADTATVALAEAKSQAQSLNVNQSSTLTNIPVVYMTCNAEAFEIGDNVIVEFQTQDWSNPRVIGFLDNPRACFSPPSIQAKVIGSLIEKSSGYFWDLGGVTFAAYGQLGVSITSEWIDDVGPRFDILSGPPVPDFSHIIWTGLHKGIIAGLPLDEAPLGTYRFEFYAYDLALWLTTTDPSWPTRIDNRDLSTPGLIWQSGNITVQIRDNDTDTIYNVLMSPSSSRTITINPEDIADLAFIDQLGDNFTTYTPVSWSKVL